MTAIRHVAVVVPARDEQDTIAATLLALRRARAALPPDVASEVLVVLDDCHDATAELVASFPDVHRVDTGAHCVGAARRLGTETLLRRTPVRLDQVWTAHTDADSTVPPNWLTCQLLLASRGAAMTLGTVLPRLSEPALTAWRSGYHDVDGHHHVHGANLGIRADVLDVLGGWPPLPSDEDLELVRRVAAAGLPIARSAAMPVGTSARLTGRAPLGFSGYLAQLPTVPTGDPVPL